jgi:hypothetical protein
MIARRLWRLYGGLVTKYGTVREVSVRDEKATLDKIVAEKASICRFSDGEISLMFGNDLYFQEYDAKLARSLRSALRRRQPGLLVGIPNFRKQAITRNAEQRLARWAGIEKLFCRMTDAGMTYYSANLTRPHGIAGLATPEYFEKFRSVWAGRDLIVVTGNEGYAEHEFFANARTVRVVRCASRNCYREHDRILEEALSRSTADCVYALSAGPTATALVPEIAAQGSQALDIGQIVREWEHSVGAKSGAGNNHGLHAQPKDQ